MPELIPKEFVEKIKGRIFAVIYGSNTTNAEFEFLDKVIERIIDEEVEKYNKGEKCQK